MTSKPTNATLLSDTDILYRELTGRLPQRNTGVDRATFNYGRALGTPNVPEFAACEKYTRALTQIACELSNQAWQIEMAMKRVRDAETPAEQLIELRAMREVWHTVDKRTETVHSAPLRFFRYGRIGNVLKHFIPHF